jgi:hypothetical protein
MSHQPNKIWDFSQIRAQKIMSPGKRKIALAITPIHAVANFN